MAKQSFHGERILLVEDHAPLLRSMVFLLTVLGFEVMTACNGVEAMDRLRLHLPDVIVSDIDMPAMDGYELLRQVRADQRWSSIAFIFASDKYSLDDLLFALDLGADDYLPKPFDVHDLLGVIRRALPLKTPRLRKIV